MAAGLGFKDFVTGEVLTAADVDGYLMQGTWVFANAAARTAAVTSPQEGNMSYLKDTNSTEYYSGSAWVAVGAAGGGMTLINTGGTALSGAGVTISSIPSTYKNLQVIVRSPSSSGGDVSTNLRFNGDTGSNYNFAYITLTENASASTYNKAQVSWVNDSASSSGLITIDIFDYANTTTKKVITTAGIENYQGGGANFNLSRIQALWNSNDAITSITVLPDAGTWSTGTVFVYGVS